MQLVGARNQQVLDYLFDASTSIGTGATLVLPEMKSRSSLYIQNVSANTIWVDIGSGTATATLTSGVVTSVSVVNAGFGYTYPPSVLFLGGAQGPVQGQQVSPKTTSGTAPTLASPSRPARGHCTLSGGAIASIVVDDGGSGYQSAPYVFIHNSPFDPVGAADPTTNSGSGFKLVTGAAPLIWNGTACPVSPIAAFASMANSLLTVKFTF